VEGRLKFLIPQGIGDSLWALTKVQDVLKQHNTEKAQILLNCTRFVNEECRSVEFVKRFDFVESCEMVKVKITKEPFIDLDGRFNYIDDGWTRIDENHTAFVMMPNGPLERGVRLENWLSQYRTNWNVANHFHFQGEEITQAERLKSLVGPYAVFFMGSLSANSVAGHNRNSVWTHLDWIELGDWLHERLGLKIVIVGAEYDREYYEGRVAPNLVGKDWWIDRIGSWSVGETFAVTSRARMIIAYQSGIGIFSNYMGVPLGIFWRAKGDSISPAYYVSFEESMASAWANPDLISGRKHLPLIYGKHDVGYVKNQIVNFGW
jgi:hypothetical protein